MNLKSIFENFNKKQHYGAVNIIVLLIVIITVFIISIFIFVKEANKSNVQSISDAEEKDGNIEFITQKYPYRRWEEGYTRFYTDEMIAKYPAIKEIAASKDYFKILSSQDNLIGVYSPITGDNIIPHKYNYMDYCSDSYGSYNMFFKTKLNHKHVIFDYNGDILYKSDYDDVACTYKGIETKNKDRHGMVNYSGKEIIPPEYDNIEYQEYMGESGGAYYIVKQGMKYGVFDVHGNIIIPLQNNKLDVIPSGQGPFFVYENQTRKGIIDIYNNIIIKPVYDYVDYDERRGDKNGKSFFKACSESGCDIFDILGNKIFSININSHDILQLNENYYAVNIPYNDDKGEKVYIFDNKGKKTAKIDNARILSALSDKYILFAGLSPEGHHGLGVANYKGNIIMHPRKDVSNISRVSDNGLIKYSKQAKYGIIYNDKIILEPEYKKIYFFRGHVMILNHEQDEKYYYISSYEDFAKNNGDISKCKKYKHSQFKKLPDDKCFKFINDNGEEDLYCDKTN